MPPETGGMLVFFGLLRGANALKFFENDAGRNFVF